MAYGIFVIFMQYDHLMVPLLKEAEERDMVLRYVGSYDAESGVCQVTLV